MCQVCGKEETDRRIADILSSRPANAFKKVEKNSPEHVFLCGADGSAGQTRGGGETRKGEEPSELPAAPGTLQHNLHLGKFPPLIVYLFFLLIPYIIFAVFLSPSPSIDVTRMRAH